MRKRGLIVSALLGGVMWTAAALAAPAQNADSTASVLGTPDLLGSWLMAGFNQYANKTGSFQFGESTGWVPAPDLFPAASSLNAMALSTTALRSSAGFSLAPGLSFGVSHTAFELGPWPDNGFSQQLALRLSPSLGSTGTTTANISWNLSDWSTIGITASHSTGNSLLLGSLGNPLVTGPSPESSALGISARVGFAEGWVTTLAYSEGVSQLDLSQMATNTVVSDAYRIGVAKTGLFGNDALGIALSRPPQIYGVTGFGTVVNNFALSTTPARESDVELGYVTSFLDGTFALQANAAYQINPAGVRGENALAAVARAKLNF